MEEVWQDYEEKSDTIPRLYKGYELAIILNIAANLHLLHVIPVTSASV